MAPDIVPDRLPYEKTDPVGNEVEVLAATDDKLSSSDQEGDNLVYDDVEVEPELHARTYIAMVAFVMLNFAMVFSLQGPPTVLSWIGADLHNPQAETWIPNCVSFVQAVLGPVLCSASDLFQARKAIIVVCCTISFIGSCIIPGAGNIYRVIVGQTLVGFGFATVSLNYVVPSEILPRRWRPMAQALINVAASLAACTGPLSIGALTQTDPHDGWRMFFWIQAALWGSAALGVFLGYRPPKRHTRLDHLSFWQKLSHLDFIGSALLTVGLALFLTGLNLGGGLYAWTNVRVLVTLILGIVIMILFGLYEWKGTMSGILHHDLFRGGKSEGRTFALCVLLIFLECFMLFCYIIFYPVLQTSLFTSDALILAARSQPFWAITAFSTVAWGYISTRYRTIREPLFAGFFIYTAGFIGLATIQPSNSTSCLVFAGLAGIGFGAPLILVITGVQLSTPHRLIATATAVTASSRAVAATVSTAICAAALNSRLTINIPKEVSQAALQAGLPAASVTAFVKALTGNDLASLSKVPGATPAVIEVSVVALKQALADSIRVVNIIAVPIGVVGCIACLFLGDLHKTMNYRVDAPVEDLHAKIHHGAGPVDA